MSKCGTCGLTQPIPTRKCETCGLTPPTPTEETDRSADGPKVTDPEWTWPVFEEFIDKKGESKLQRLVATNVDGGKEAPFEVIYRRKHPQLWPDVVRVKVCSSPLIQILQQYLPDDAELKCVTKPTVAGRDLFVVLGSLKNHEFIKTGDGKLAVQKPDDGVERRKLNSNGNASLRFNELGTNDKSAPPLQGSDESCKPSGDGDSRPAIKAQEVKSIDGRPVETLEPVTSKSPSTSVRRTGELYDEPEREPVVDGDVGELHLKHLIRFLEEEYKDVLAKVARMRQEKQVAWDMLWAFLPRGTKVVYRCEQSEELLCGVVSGNFYWFNYCGKLETVFFVALEVWDYDGQCYRKCQVARPIKEFMGVHTLHCPEEVCPIEFMGDKKQLEKDFLANGKMFYKLAVKSPQLFMRYTGPLFEYKYGKIRKELRKERADGRVMIDLISTAKMNTKLLMGNAGPPSSRMSSLRGGSRDTIRNVDNGAGYMDAALSEVPTENLIYAPAIVYGFSFALKQWGAFVVHGFKEIVFDTIAFEELAMDANMKDLIYKVVTEHLGTTKDQGALKRSNRVDPIANKGEGCVILCYGPPGSGKTLTAESLAEKAKRPLWSLSVSELGTTPDDLEKNLSKVLDVATTWQAVLLLDEADVYLEKRSGSDLIRNAMTGVFLRMLEYYRGVLFLTTNRIGTFDEAFRSRISIFVSYKQLTVEDREKIWYTLLRRGGVEGVTAEFCREMAARELNGREIRNAIHTAQVWAKSTEKPVAAWHVEHVMGLLASALDCLNEVLQNSDPAEIPHGSQHWTGWFRNLPALLW